MLTKENSLENISEIDDKSNTAYPFIPVFGGCQDYLNEFLEELRPR